MKTSNFAGGMVPHTAIVIFDTSRRYRDAVLYEAWRLDDPEVLIRKRIVSGQHMLFIQCSDFGKWRPGDMIRIKIMDNNGEVIDTYSSKLSCNAWDVAYIIGDLELIEKTDGELRLFQNYPNPFKKNTTFTYLLPEKSQVKMRIYDLRGRLINRVLDKEQSAGLHHIIWNGTDNQENELPSGIYICRFFVNGVSETMKISLLR